jgi:hypothetical protein
MVCETGEVPGVTVVRSGGDPDEGGRGGTGPEAPGGRIGRPGRQARSDARGARGARIPREGDVADATAGGAGSGAPSLPREGDHGCAVPGPQAPETAPDVAHLRGSAPSDDAGTVQPPAPEDRPWTPIPRQARPLEAGLIPAQRRLKKTSRSA